MPSPLNLFRCLRRVMAAGAALVAAGLSAVLTSAAAMTVETHADTVYASGPVGDDLLAFERALAMPGVTRVVFVNSPGGDLWTGLRVGRLIAGRGLDTVSAGHCNSACAVMFLGGRDRRFADTFAPALTHLGLHGAHRTDTRAVDPVLQPQIYAWFKQRMGDRFNSALMNKALYEMDDRGGMLRLYDVARLPRRVVTHCRSEQTPRKDCSEFPQDDALSLGAITQAELVSLVLPPAFRPSMVVFGQALGADVGAIEPWLDGVAASACSGDPCRQRMRDWKSRRDHWALAVGVGGGVSGWGRAEGRDTLQLAAVSALYHCNHRSGGVAALCELEAADGLSGRPLYRQAEAAHAAALAQLKPPAERLHANEEFGGGLTSADAGLRTQRLADITPLQVPGVRTLVSGDLAAALMVAPRPVLVDVSSASDTLPGAQALWNGGLAFEEAKAEEAYESRFKALLALLAPDRAAPLVFFCGSRNCWQSVNAARRAARAGWQQVQWYRGGLEAWRAAGLPVVPPLVRAVAY